MTDLYPAHSAEFTEEAHAQRIQHHRQLLAKNLAAATEALSRAAGHHSALEELHDVEVVEGGGTLRAALDAAGVALAAACARCPDREASDGWK